ncbi:MAG: hypothetical protein JST76_12285 [Bacteroidetes bacterium]|nr:hypothetical protein [Bacteroidota bacterium]
MKTRNAILSLLLLFCSCKKDNTPLSVIYANHYQGTSPYKVKRILTQTGQHVDSIIYHYDQLGRVIYEENKNRGPEAWDYSNNTFQILSELQETLNGTLNTDGLIATFHSVQSTTSSDCKYDYDSVRHLKTMTNKFTRSSSIEYDTIHMTWINGNLTKLEHTNYSALDLYYTYTSFPENRDFVIGNPFLTYNELDNASGIIGGTNSQNLIATQTDKNGNTIYSYSYIFDSIGRVAKQIVSYDQVGEIDTMTFTYY